MLERRPHNRRVGLGLRLGHRLGLGLGLEETAAGHLSKLKRGLQVV